MESSFLKKSICFLILLSLVCYSIDKLIEFGLTKNYNSLLGKINLLVEHKIDPEIIVFGASTAQVGINAPLMEQITQKSTYNAAIDGTTLKQYECILQHYNNYSKNCKLVIFVVSPFALFSNNKLNAIERYLPHIDDDLVYKSLSGIDPYLSLKCRYVPLYKYTQVSSNYYMQSMSGWKAYLNSGDKPTNDPLQGYNPVSQTWQRDQDARNIENPQVEVQIDSTIYELHKRVLNDLRMKNRKVIILFPPVQKDGLNKINGFNKLIDCYKKLSEDSGYLFLNYSNCDISCDKRWFYNNSHLNKQGSEAFTEKLSKKITEFL